MEAPTIFASCRQATATPPPIPTIRRFRLARSVFLPNSMRQAVRCPVISAPGRDKVGVVRQRKEAVTWHRDIIRKATIPMLAHDLDAFAKRLIASKAVAALSAKRVRIEDRLHARLEAAVRRGLDHFACGFHAHHLRQRVSDAHPAVAHVEINPVDRRSGHAQNGLARRRSRIGKVAPTYTLDAASLQYRSLHTRLPVSSLSGASDPLGMSSIGDVNGASSMATAASMKLPRGSDALQGSAWERFSSSATLENGEDGRRRPE